MSEIFRFGAERVKSPDRIKKGLMYEDGRGKVATVDDCFLGIVTLIWLESGKRSYCQVKHFCKRFSLYGNGHSV